jgi:predicted dehydrogenase
MLNVALVGVGHIHTPGFIKKLKERADVKVKYVWDPDKERAKKRAEELGTKAVGSASKAWNDPEIAAAIVCSETNLHKKLVLAGAAAKKHLFVEKPLGLGAADGFAMADAIEKAGVLFQTGYFSRSNPALLFLREQIQKGNFGKITRVRGSNCHAGSLKGWFDTEWRWMADPKVAGRGAFGDLGTHPLDILLWWLGDVASATASVDKGTARYGECDEYGEGLLRFKNGVVGTLAAGWVDVANPVSYLISGTEGHAYIDNGKLFFQSSKVPGAEGKEPWTQLPAGLPHAFDLFLDAITGKQGVPLVTAKEAAYRSAVMEAMYQGAKRQRWVAPKDGTVAPAAPAEPQKTE